MNRLEIRQAVRDILGETHEGFWTDDELNRYIQLASNRHAQEGLSVPTTVRTTSLPGLQEYQLPPEFGEMREVRWHTTQGEHWTLDNVPKCDIQDMQSLGTQVDTGDPYSYYNDAGFIGLYPVPNKPPLFEFAPPAGGCNWQTLDLGRDPDDDSVTEIYSEDVYLSPEEDDICDIYCAHVSLWMRRNARPIDGAFRLRIKPLGKPEYEYNYSGYVNIRDLGVLPEWIHFDFTFDPIEFDSAVPGYNFSFILDADFYNIPRTAYGDDGPQFAVEEVDGMKSLYFQFHQYRNDIEINYYKNEIGPINTDYEDLEIPNAYHRTLVKMVVAYALRKGGRDTPYALVWEAEVDKEIKAARAQAVLRTRGRIQRTEGRRGRYYGPDATYNNGTWRIRSW